MLAYCMGLYVLINLGFFRWLPSANNWLPIISAVFIGIAIKLWQNRDAKPETAKSEG